MGEDILRMEAAVGHEGEQRIPGRRDRRQRDPEAQPLEPVWNELGYANNVVHRVRVRYDGVTQAP